MGHELPLDPRSFRQSMALFATGVAVLTVPDGEGGVIGMTVNALTSVSLDPLLLLVCIEKTANMAQHVLDADLFSINILRADQAALSDYFAGRRPEKTPPSFRFEDWAGGAQLVGCVSAVGCARYDLQEGGDHWILIGRVVALYCPDSPPEPLMFYRSRYRSLAAQED